MNIVVGAAYGAIGTGAISTVKSYASDTLSEYAQKFADDAYDGEIGVNGIGEATTEYSLPTDAPDPLGQSAKLTDIKDGDDPWDQDIVTNDYIKSEDHFSADGEAIENSQATADTIKVAKEGADDVIDTAEMAGEEAADEATTLGATSEAAADVDTVVTIGTAAGEVAAE